MPAFYASCRNANSLSRNAALPARTVCAAGQICRLGRSALRLRPRYFIRHAQTKVLQSAVAPTYRAQELSDLAADLREIKSQDASLVDHDAAVDHHSVDRRSILAIDELI